MERDPKHGQLTGSLVFDEEQLEALLESVFIHIEFYLHPKRGIERWAETEREIRRMQEKKKKKSTQEQKDKILLLWSQVKRQTRGNKWRAGKMKGIA